MGASPEMLYAAQQYRDHHKAFAAQVLKDRAAKGITHAPDMRAVYFAGIVAFWNDQRAKARLIFSEAVLEALEARNLSRLRSALRYPQDEPQPKGRARRGR